MNDAFAVLLARYRTRRRLSQAALGRAAGLDHSLISRYESGERTPERATTLALADALALTDGERDLLLLAAGYAPCHPSVRHLVAFNADRGVGEREKAALYAALPRLLEAMGGRDAA